MAVYYGTIAPYGTVIFRAIFISKFLTQSYFTPIVLIRLTIVIIIERSNCKVQYLYRFDRYDIIADMILSYYLFSYK